MSYWGAGRLWSRPIIQWRQILCMLVRGWRLKARPNTYYQPFCTEGGGFSDHPGGGFSDHPGVALAKSPETLASTVRIRSYLLIDFWKSQRGLELLVRRRFRRSPSGKKVLYVLASKWAGAVLPTFGKITIRKSKVSTSVQCGIVHWRCSTDLTCTMLPILSGLNEVAA